MIVDENIELQEMMLKNKALFVLDAEDTITSEETLEPTLENLKKALGNKVGKSKDYFHEASKIKFKLCPMSSSGYTALHNVSRLNPVTNARVSSDQEDERERSIVYLTYGVSKPKLTRESAENILDAPGWGPSNIGLVNAVAELNPSAEQRIDNFMILMGLARFQLIWFRVMEESGGLDKYCTDLNLTEDTREALRTCIAMFSFLFKVDETSKGWGLPLGIGALVNKPVIEEVE